MTDVKLEEQDACLWPGLIFWLCHAVPPMTPNKPRCHRAPDSLLQNADDNSLSYWGAVKIKPLLSGKHSDFVTREAAEEPRQAGAVSLSGWTQYRQAAALR